jgi:hypothetical protein
VGHHKEWKSEKRKECPWGVKKVRVKERAKAKVKIEEIDRREEEERDDTRMRVGGVDMKMSQ